MHGHGNAVRAGQDEFVQGDGDMPRAELPEAYLSHVFRQRFHQLSGVRQRLGPQCPGDGIITDGP